MTNRWGTDILELRNIHYNAIMLSTFTFLTSWDCVINALSVSWSVVIISVRLWTGAGLVMILGTVRRGKRRRTRRVMVVGGAVRERGQRGAHRVNWLLRPSQLKTEAEGEWKAWSLGYRGRGGEARIKVDSDKIQKSHSYSL